MQLNNNIGFNGMTGLQLLQDVKDKTNASYKQANNVNNADLSSMFTQIAEDITTYEASNVTIIDKLTNAVDIVTKTDEVIPADDLRVRVMHGNTDVTDAEVNAGRIVASYDNQSKELKLDFNDNYKLKADYTYSVTVTIKPNQNALNAYVNNNSSYPDTGEEDTGASSAGKRGIFSNVDNSAYVTWDRMKNNDVVSEGNSGAYNRPVVQIKMLNVTKTFENEEVANNIKNKTTNPYNIKITGDFTAGKQDSPVTVTKQLTDSDVVETVDQVTGEVTYTWPPLLIFGFSDSTHNQNNLYTISEENYNTTDDSNWKYDSTSWNAIGGQITPDTDISTMITTSANYISIPDVNKPEKAPEYTVNCINHYVEKVDLDLVKTSEHTNAQIDGAEFKLYKGTETSVGDTTGIDWTAKQQVGNTIIVNQLNEEPEIKGLDDGYYELVETKAPSSHSLLATSIYFKVSGGVISLCDKDGNGIENQDMWSLAISDGNVLTVKNAVLYDLPSTGGRGIFWYLISGTLLMMAGALILYRNKHGEVLRG